MYLHKSREYERVGFLFHLDTGHWAIGIEYQNREISLLLGPVRLIVGWS